MKLAKRETFGLDLAICWLLAIVAAFYNVYFQLGIGSFCLGGDKCTEPTSRWQITEYLWGFFFFEAVMAFLWLFGTWAILKTLRRPKRRRLLAATLLYLAIALISGSVRDVAGYLAAGVLLFPTSYGFIAIAILVSRLIVQSVTKTHPDAHS